MKATLLKIAAVAGLMAGVATGAWTEEQTSEMWREAARYEPSMSDGERERLLCEWGRAIERSKRWATG